MPLYDYNTTPTQPDKTGLRARTALNPNQRFIDEGRAIVQERVKGYSRPDLLMQDMTDDDYLAIGQEQGKEEEHGFVGELTAGLGRGALRVAATPAYLADVAGEAMGFEGLEKAGEYGAEKVEEFIAESPRLRKSQSISGDIRDNPQLWTDPKWYASIVGEGAPTIASMILPGTAVARFAKFAGMGVKGIQAARMGGALTAGMGLEAGGAAEDIRQYEKRTGEKVPTSKKLQTVAGTGFIAGSLEAVPIFNLFGKAIAKKLIGRIVTSMALEGGTEGAQEIVANAFAKAGYDADRDMVGGVIESVVGGVLLGGGMGAMQQTFHERIKKTDAGKVSDILEEAEGETQAKPDLVNMIDKGIAEQSITPAHAIALIKEAYADKALTSEDLESLGEKYPDLKNGIISGKISSEIDQEITTARDVLLGAGEKGITAKSILTGEKPAPTETTKEAKQVDIAAQEAATSPLNETPEPTEAQIEAGNYKKGHIEVQGFDISVENPEGSQRSGTSPDGKKWSITMAGNHYGYFNRSEGKDGEQIDVFVNSGERRKSYNAYIVDQVDPKTGKFDESKVMMGYPSLEDAEKGYLANYEKGWKGLGNITEVSIDDLKKFVGKRQAKPYSQAPPKTDIALEAEGVEKVAPVEGEKEPVKFIGMQKIEGEPSQPLVEATTGKLKGGQIDYDAERHEMVNLDEYEKAVKEVAPAKKASEELLDEEALKYKTAEEFVEKQKKGMQEKLRQLQDEYGDDVFIRVIPEGQSYKIGDIVEDSYIWEYDGMDFTKWTKDKAEGASALEMRPPPKKISSLIKSTDKPVSGKNLYKVEYEDGTKSEEFFSSKLSNEDIIKQNKTEIRNINISDWKALNKYSGKQIAIITGKRTGKGEWNIDLGEVVVKDGKVLAIFESKSNLTDIWEKTHAKPQPAAIPKQTSLEAATEQTKAKGIPEVKAKETWDTEFAKTYKKSEFPEHLNERWDDFKAFSKKSYAEGNPIDEDFEVWMKQPFKKRMVNQEGKPAEKLSVEAPMAEYGTADPFYSQVIKTVETKMPNKMAASDVMNWLKKQPRIKQAELEWMDVDGMLEGKKVVTRDELAELLRSNEVRVEEVEIAQKFDPIIKKLKDKYSSLPSHSGSWSITVLRENGVSQAEQDQWWTARMVSGHPRPDPTKFSQYQAPLSRDTEVLTNKGWVNVCDLKIGDIAISRKDDNGILEWAEIEAIPQHYSKKLIHFSSSSLDVMATPQHTMLYLNSKYKKDGKIYRATAERLFSKVNILIPLTGNGLVDNITSLYGLDGRDVGELIGWFLSEGSFSWKNGRKQTPQIAQTESHNPLNCRRIESLLDRLRIKWSRNGNSYYLNVKTMPKELVSLLKEQPTSLNKFIPNELFMSGKYVLGGLYDGLILGDGSTIKKTGVNRQSQTKFYTGSKRLIDDFQRLLILIGKTGNVKQANRKLPTKRFGKNVEYYITVKIKTTARADKAKREYVDYNDIAYCVTVKNHAICIRRNGISSFTGNSGKKENYRELLFTLPSNLEEGYKEGTVSKAEKVASDFYGTHWTDTPNVFAHVRINERTDADGNRLLFVEEVQSDWGKALMDELDTFKEERYPQIAKMEKGKELTGLEQKAKNEFVALKQKGKYGTTPFMPLWDKSSEYVMKRIVRMAAEQGFDKVSWITGEQTESRYDLSKKIEALHAFKQKDGGYVLNAIDFDGNNLIGKVVPESKIEDHVGKEIAGKIISGENTDQGYSTPPGESHISRQTFEGDDLKTKAAWAYNLYDKMIPQYLKKFGKKYDAEVGTSEIETTGWQSKQKYIGDNYTIEDVKKATVVAEQSGKNIFESPITGERQSFPVNRVKIVRGLREIQKGMESGASFAEAASMQDRGTAELFGGKIEKTPQAETVHAFNITPELKRIAMSEGFAIMASKEAYGSQEKADQAVESIAKSISDKSMPDRVSKIAKELRAKKRVDFTGRKLTPGNESQEIAEMFQVYRSPKLEILHVIYTSKDGTILNHNAMTSGQLDYVAPKDFSQYSYKIKSAADRLGAAKIHILHNHPSGNPTMSQQDVNVAGSLSKKFGEQMGEFVVIDHDTFTKIDKEAGDSWRTVSGKFKPSQIEDWTAGKTVIPNAPTLATFGKSLAYDKNKAVFIYLNSQNEVQGWTVHDKKILTKGSLKIKSIVKQQAKAHDASRAVIIADDNTMLTRIVRSGKVGSWLVDVQNAEGESLREAHPSSFEVVTGKRKQAWGLFQPTEGYEAIGAPTGQPGYKELLKRYEASKERTNTTNQTAEQDGSKYKGSSETGQAAIENIMADLRKVTKSDAVKYNIEKEQKIIKEYRKLEALAKDSHASVASKQKMLAAFLKVLPTNVRAKVITPLTFISRYKEVKTHQKRIDEALSTTEKELSFYLRRSIMSDIVKGVKPKKLAKNRIKKDTIGHEAARDLQFIRDTLQEKDITSRITQLESQLVAKESELEEADESRIEIIEEQISDLQSHISIVETFGNIKSQTLDDLIFAKEAISSIILEGRALWRLQSDAFKETLNPMIAKVQQDISGQEEPTLETSAEATKRAVERESTWGTAKGTWDAVENSVLSWEFLMNKLSKLSGDKIMQSYTTTEMGSVAQSATKQENILNIETDESTHLNAKRIFNVETDDALNKKFIKQEVKQTGKVISYKDGKQVDAFAISQMEAAYMYAIRKNQDSIPTFDKMGMTNKTFQEIEAFIGAELKAWVDFNVDEYLQDFHFSVNQVYRQVYGTNLTKTPGYISWYRDVPGKVQEKGIAAGPHETGAKGMSKGAFKERVKNTNPYRFMSFNDVLTRHISEMNNFKAWAMPTKIINGVFNNRKTQRLIIQHYSPNIRNAIKSFQADFTKSPLEMRGEMAWLDKMRGNITTAMTALNPTIFLKQLTSIPAMAESIPTNEWIKYSVDFWANPLKAWRLLKESKHWESRRKRGMERDIRTAQAVSGSQAVANVRNLKNRAMFLVKWGDGAAILVGGYPVYKYHFDNNIKKMGKDKAHEFALKKFEEAMDRTQQASGIKDQGKFQRSGSYAKLFSMFLTAPKQYTSQITAAIRQIHSNPKDGDAYKRLFIFGVMMPSLFQATASGLIGLIGGDDDDEKEFISDQIKAILQSPLNGIPIIRDLQKGVWESAMGEWYGTNVDYSPVTSAGQSLMSAIFNGAKLFSDDDAEKRDKHIEETLNNVFETAGYAYGLPVETVRKMFMENWADIVTGKTDYPVRRALGYSRYATNEQDSKFTKEKRRLKKIKGEYDESKNKPAFKAEHLKDLRDYNRINNLQGRLNKYSKRINHIKSRPETREGKIRIQRLEEIRTRMIKNYLKNK